MMVEDGDLLKEEDIRLEEDRNGFTVVKKRNKLKAIKETFRKFRVCIKSDPRDKWIALTEDLPVITQDNYKVDNIFGVQAFYDQQTNLVAKSLDGDDVEVTKEYLQDTKKNQEVRRSKTTSEDLRL